MHAHIKAHLQFRHMRNKWTVRRLHDSPFVRLQPLYQVPRQVLVDVVEGDQRLLYLRRHASHNALYQGHQAALHNAYPRVCSVIPASSTILPLTGNATTHHVDCLEQLLSC